MHLKSPLSNLNISSWDNGNFDPPTQWIVVVFYILLAFGCLLNVANFLALVRTRKNGTLTIILQIALVDILSIYVAVSEISALNTETWPFSTELCPLFTGTEIFLNTLTTYLLVCFNFHLISLWNVHQYEAKTSNKNPLTSTKGDSNECLVTKQENRQVTIDYRKRKNRISVLFPATFVWFVSLSLSIPNFTLSSTIKLKGNVVCAIIDVYYGSVLQYSLISFKILIPVFLLFLSFIMIVCKLSRSTDSNVDNFLTVKTLETRKYLIFAIALTVLYVLTSVQRLVSHCVHIISYSFGDKSLNNFRMPPLYNDLHDSVPYLAMLHYLGGPLRAILYLMLLPKFRYLLKTKLFVCCGRK